MRGSYLLKSTRAVFILLAALLMSLISACERNEVPSALTKAPEIKSGAQAGGQGDAENIFIKVAREANPAVVNIRSFQSVEDTGGLSYTPSEQTPDDRYQYPGQDKNKPHAEQNVGSGVIISPDGYIITNAHVVVDSTDIKVKLSDSREFAAKLIGADTKTDIAVLKIEGKGPLPVVKLGDSSNLQIGQWAIAIGNPFGLDHTVTVGVVSAVGRADVGVVQYENFIQTDASINPGNSGGPLLNSAGEVIGINTAIMSSGQGISFSIPVNMVKDIAKVLIEKGKVVRGWLGVGIQSVTPDVAAAMGARPGLGVLVNRVFKGSPAEVAHIELGDIILSYDGKPMSEARQLQNAVASTLVGKVVEIRIIRQAKERSIRIKIEEMTEAEEPEKQEKPEVETVGQLWLTVRPITGAAAEGVAPGGVVVVDVEGGSPAEKAGMDVGDIIVSVGLTKINGVKEFKKAAARLKKGQPVALLVVRGGSPVYIAYKAGP